MKRMKCIGAQSVVATQKNASLAAIEIPCRREDGPTHYRTFFRAALTDPAEMFESQLPLFEEMPRDLAHG